MIDPTSPADSASGEAEALLRWLRTLDDSPKSAAAHLAAALAGAEERGGVEERERIAQHFDALAVPLEARLAVARANNLRTDAGKAAKRARIVASTIRALSAQRAPAADKGEPK